MKVTTYKCNKHYRHDDLVTRLIRSQARSEWVNAAPLWGMKTYSFML